MTSLLKFGFTVLKADPKGPEFQQLQKLLLEQHASKHYVFIGSPYYVLEEGNKLPKDYEGPMQWYTGTPLGLLLPEGAQFTSFRTLKSDDTVFKPSWASAMAHEKGYDIIGDLGTGKLSVHDRDGAVLSYYEELENKSVEKIEAILEQYPGVPIFATGAWRKRDQLPKGAELLSHEEEARLTAKSVAEFIDHDFVLIEMGKGSTQVVTLLN